MKNRIVFLGLFTILLFNFDLLGQEISKLEIAGKAQLMVIPDLAILNVQITAVEMEYKQAIESLNQKTKKLQKQLVKMDFAEDAIKTINFSVRKNYVYKKGERIDSGFVASHSLRLEFPYNKERLGRLIDNLGASAIGADAQFGFDLSIEKKKEVEAKLIAMALEDANSKAKIIESSAEIELIKIIHIQYQGMSQPSPVYRYQASARMEADASPPALEAREIEMNREVMVVWSFK